MRRIRINVKPNVRPGSRSSSTGDQTTHGTADGDTTLLRVNAEKTVMPSPSPHSEEEPALCVKNDPQSPLEKSSIDQHDAAPSSGSSTPAAAPQRRMRFSAAPKLSKPRVTSAPRPSARTPSLAAPNLSTEETLLDSTPESTASVSVNSNNLSDSGICHSTSPTEVATQLSASHPPSSPCVPSTSGLQTSCICDKSVENGPPSPQPGQVPLHPPENLGHPECCTQASDVPSACVKSSCFNTSGSLKETDKDKILRALKLKELMKIERRKDIERAKKNVRKKQDYTSVDRNKMTMRDLIYYLPNTSPMRSSIMSEDQTEVTAPPSPRVPEKTQDTDEEAGESENEAMLMPKVRVAEDGSIVLDEDSLTVRVEKTSNTAVVENSNPLFERGSTTTYRSFKNFSYVKSWSIRETDMFYLAISMVGTDFSLIGQLLQHRSRPEIKNKFKKEEKTSAWRIDKAFRNKRPYDKEFFGFLLERVLAKDKEKGNSVKLVMNQSRRARKTRGSKVKKVVCEDECFNGDEEDFEMEDDEDTRAGKENENLSNMTEADTAPTKRKRKRTRNADEVEDGEDLSQEGVKKKKRKRSKKTPKGITSPCNEVEDDCGLFNLDEDTVKANEEDELDSKALAPRKRCRASKKGKEGEVEKPSDGGKGSRHRKSRKVSNDGSIDANEGGIADMDHSMATTKKCKRSKKGDLNEEVDKNGEASTTRASVAEKSDTLTPDNGVDMPQRKSGRYAQKPKPKLGARGRKRSVEHDATTELEIQAETSPVEKGELQKEVVDVMEGTPPRAENIHSPSKLQCVSKESGVPLNPPASPVTGESSSSMKMKMQRAERAKRNLTFGGQKGRKKAIVDDDDDEESEHDAASEDKERSPEQAQESEHSDMNNTLDEKLKDFSCLNALDSPMFQRRPLVMLSREEVDMILSAQDQTTAEQPSPSSSPPLSPLDLSLNTEMSFQLSNIMVANAEMREDECMVGGPPETDSSAVLDIKKSALGPSDLSSTSDLSTSLNPDMNSKPVVSKVDTSCPSEKPEPQTHTQTDKDTLESVASEDSAYTKPTAHGTHERPVVLSQSETHWNSSPNQDSEEASKTSVLALVQGSVHSPSVDLKSLQESVVASSQNGDRSQETVASTPDVMKGLQGCELNRAEIKEDSESSLLEPPEVSERPQETVLPEAKIMEGLQVSELTRTEIEEDAEGPAEVSDKLQETVLSESKIMEGLQASELITTEIKENSERMLREPSEFFERSQDSIIETPGIKDASDRSVLIPKLKGTLQGSRLEQESVVAGDILESSHECVVPTKETVEGLPATELITPEIKENSERSLLEPGEILEMSQDPVVTILEFKEGSQEALLEPSEVSQKSVVVTSDIKGSLLIPKLKETLQGSHLEPGEVLTRSPAFGMATSEIERSDKPALLNPQIKQMPVGSAAMTNEDPLEKETHAISPSSRKLSGTSDSSEHGIILKRRSRLLKPKPNLNLASRIMHVSPKQKIREPNKMQVPSVASDTVLEQEQKLTTATLSTVSVPVLQLASDQTRSIYDLESTPNPQSIAENLQRVDASYVWPLPAQTTEQERTGQVTETYKDVYAPAEIIHSAADGQSNEEPTFILTLYEIPVAQLNSFASNDSPMTSDLHSVEVQSLSMSSTLPSTPACPRSTCLPMKIGESKKECLGISQNEFSDPLGVNIEGYAENVILDLSNTLEKVTGFNEESSGSPPEQEWNLSVETIKEKDTADVSRHLQTPSQEKSSLSSMLEEKAALKPVMKFDQQVMTQVTQETTTPQAKVKSKEVSALQEVGDIFSVPSKDLKSLCREGSELNDFQPRNQSTPLSIRVSKCIKSSAHESLDIEQIPSENLQKVKSPTAVSYPLFSAEDSKYKLSSSEEKKIPPKRKGKLLPKLVKRSLVKNDSTKTAQPVMESQPTLSQVVLLSEQTMVPQAKEDSSPISKRLVSEGRSDVPKEEGKEYSVSDVPEGDVLQQKQLITPCTIGLLKRVDMLPQNSEEAEDCASVSHVETADVFKSVSEEMQDIIIKGTAPEENVAGITCQEDDSPKKSLDRILSSQEIKMRVQKEMCRCDLEPTQSESTSSWQSKIQELEYMPSEVAVKLLSEDAAIKQNIDLSSKHKESSGSKDLEDAEEECEDVSHMVLADVFVPVMDKMEDLNEEWKMPFVSSPTREEVGPFKTQEVRFRNVDKVENKDFSSEFNESMKQNDFLTKENKALTTKTGKQQVKRASAKDDSLKTTSHIKDKKPNNGSSDPSIKLEKTDMLYVPKIKPCSKVQKGSNLVPLEGELKKHEIIPCTVRISKCSDAQLQEQSTQKAKEHLEQGSNEALTKVGTEATSNSPKRELSLEGNDDSFHEGVCSQGYHEAKPCTKTTCTDLLLPKAEMSSSAHTPSGTSRQPSTLEEPSELVVGKRPARMKANIKLSCAKQLGIKDESSDTSPPHLGTGDLNSPHRMRQLPITAWTKKMSIHPAAKVPKGPQKTSEINSSFKANKRSPLVSNTFKGTSDHQSATLTVEKTSGSTVQPPDLETEKAFESVPLIAQMETPGDIPALSKINKQYNEGPSGSHKKKLPARSIAKPQLKSRPCRRTCAKDEHTFSKTVQPPSTPSKSPRPQHTRGAKILEDSDKTTSKIEKKNPESTLLPSDSCTLPKSPALSPRVILTRVDVQTRENSSSSFCIPTSSPAEVSTSTCQPMASPQRMTPCIASPPQSCSPVPNEDTKDEPSRVSQFFIQDIFTEIGDGD